MSPVDEQIRRLTPAGLSPPVLLPHSGDFYDREFTEWNGEVLYTTGFRNNLLYRLHAGAFESVAAPFFGALYAVAGSRLFAAGTGSDVHLYNGSGWSATTGIEGSPEAVDALLAGDSSLFAVRGAEVWRRDGADWTRLPRPPLVDNVPRGFVFQNRPILVNGSRLLAFDGSAWMDLGPFQADVFFTSYAPVPPTLVTPNEFWISAHVDTLLRYRDGVLTTFHNSSFASPPPGGPFENHPTTHVREMGGAIVVFGTAGDAYRLAEDVRLASSSRAFPELTDYWFRRWGKAVEAGRFFPCGQKPPRRPRLRDPRRDVANRPAAPIAPHGRYTARGLLAKQGEDFLTTFGGALLLGGLSLTDAGVFAQRGDQPAFSVDPSGLFATSTSFDASYSPHVRLLLCRRSAFGKAIAASPWTALAGVGWRRYRTTSHPLILRPRDVSCGSRKPGAASSPAFDVFHAAPGRQVRVEIPCRASSGRFPLSTEGR